MSKSVSSVRKAPAGIYSKSQSTRFLQKDGQWAVMEHGSSGWVRRGAISASSVEELLQQGKLARTSDGYLVPATEDGGIGRGEAAQRRRSPASPRINDKESPLSWLRTRKDKLGRPLITDEQFMAGERLRIDFERSMLSQRVTSSWDPAAGAQRSGGHVQAELSDGALCARQRFHLAMDAAGPELSNILYQVCCLAAGLEQAERLLDLPQRSGKAVLGLALNALVRHYSLSGQDRSNRRPFHWGASGYRPEIQELEDA